MKPLHPQGFAPTRMHNFPKPTLEGTDGKSGLTWSSRHPVLNALQGLVVAVSASVHQHVFIPKHDEWVVFVIQKCHIGRKSFTLLLPTPVEIISPSRQKLHRKIFTLSSNDVKLELHKVKAQSWWHRCCWQEVPGTSWATFVTLFWRKDAVPFVFTSLC